MPDLERPGRSGEPGVNGGAEAVEGECMLALQVQPDRFDVLSDRVSMAMAR